MLRTTSGLSRSVGRWMGQVAASVGATLMATVIYGALPKAVVPTAPPQASEALSEVTSGGKFAARAVRPAADDGLDTMPLPRVAPVAVPAAFLASTMPADALPPGAMVPATVAPAAAMRQALWTGPAPLLSERPAHAAKPVHAPARVEVKRVVPVVEPVAPTPAPLAEAASEGGLMVKVVSTARGAWSLTTSASDALMARVIPQIP